MFIEVESSTSELWDVDHCSRPSVVDRETSVWTSLPNPPSPDPGGQTGGDFVVGSDRDSKYTKPSLRVILLSVKSLEGSGLSSVTRLLTHSVRKISVFLCCRIVFLPLKGRYFSLESRFGSVPKRA